MKLPRDELLKTSRHPKELEKLIVKAEKVLKTWQPIWTSFVTAPLREEVLRIMAPLNGIHWYSDGGHPTAERQRLRCVPYHDEIPIPLESAPIKGLQIEGNFLFDRATAKDFRQAIETLEVPSSSLGDLWIIGDRGAQAICTPELSASLHNKESFLRDIPFFCKEINLEQLRLPAKRLSKKLQTVEASTRIDAIASAGFGISRAKVTNQIKAGQLRLNWEPITQASKEVNLGDQIQLEGKGSLKVMNLGLTKRNRWRVELLRE